MGGNLLTEAAGKLSAKILLNYSKSKALVLAGFDFRWPLLISTRGAVVLVKFRPEKIPLTQLSIANR